MGFICPNCERELRNANQWHHCAKVEIGDLFKNKAIELEFVFDKLLAEIVDWQDILVSATKNCIVFVNSQTFLVVRPMKKELDIKFYSERPIDASQIYKIVAYSGRFEHHIRVSTLDQIDNQIIAYIRSSYNLFKK